MSAWAFGANKKSDLVDVVALEVLAGGGPLEQLAEDRVSSMLNPFPSQSDHVSPSLPP